ncbi:MAG: PAS domain S-box protein [Granulosicoccus sp.]
MSQLEKYKLAFDITPLPMLLVSKSGQIVLVNELFGALFEYEPQQLAGQNVEVLIPDVNRHGHQALRDGYFTAPSKRTMGHGRELSGITRSGTVIPLELGLDTVLIENQVHAMVIALDITTRKQNERFMNVVVGAAASAMIMVNTQGNIVFLNTAALDLFGYEEQELMNVPLEKLVPENAQHVHRQYLDSYMLDQTARSMAEAPDIVALHKNGNHIPVDIALTPVDTPDGNMVVCTIIDLSERVSAEKAMADKSSQLELANQELQKFAYSASHDLKSPITTMAGLIGFCIEDLENENTEELRANLHKALDIGRRSMNKVERVLQIARIGHIQAEPQLFDLEGLIRELWLDLAGEHQGNIDLQLKLEHSAPIFFERRAIGSILGNLISNAVRYSDDAKAVQTVKIESQVLDDDLHIRVKDNGLGIPASSHDNVFDMFLRINEKSNHGLGLSLVKKQVNDLNGTITFNSTEGEGTEFRFSLPLPEEQG